MREDKLSIQSMDFQLNPSCDGRNPPSWMKSAIADEIAFGGYKDGFNFIRTEQGFHPNLFGFHREQSERFHYCII